MCLAQKIADFTIQQRWLTQSNNADCPDPTTLAVMVKLARRHGALGMKSKRYPPSRCPNTKQVTGGGGGDSC